jgi:hypothetical protein
MSIVRILTRSELRLLVEKAGCGDRRLVPEMTKHSASESSSKV